MLTFPGVWIGGGSAGVPSAAGGAGIAPGIVGFVGTLPVALGRQRARVGGVALQRVAAW